MLGRRVIAALAATSVLGWALIAPPYGGPPAFWSNGTGCADPGHLDTCAPPSFWRKLGSFESAVDCRRARDERIAAAANDVEWADMQESRCVPAARLRGGPFRPDE